jgi:CheY-like chemotaxis protein
LLPLSATMESPLVLISDDDSALIRSLERQAIRAGLWVISDVNSDVVRITREFRPDLIILDMGQSIDGLELLARLKKDPLTADVPVVVLTADARWTLRDRAIKLGAALVMLKPFDVRFVTEMARLAGDAFRRRLNFNGPARLARASGAN